MINPNDYTPSHGGERWKPGDIIGSEHLNTIEDQLDILSDLMIDERRIGSTLTMVEESSSMPTKLEVKTMSSEAGGITPTPPTTNLDKSILFADGYNLINVTSSIDNTNNKQDFTIYRSYSTPGTGNLASFSIGAASTSNIGLMSSTDKTHLDTIWDGKLLSNATIITSNNMVTQGESLGFVTDNNFSTKIATIGAPTTSSKGLVPALSNNASLFLDGLGNWTTINYLPLSGGTITGQIKKAGASTSWIAGRDGAALKTTSVSGYSATISTKTTNGSWEMGAYDYNDETNRLIFTYITDATYDANNNVATAQIRFRPDGYVQAAGFAGNGSGLTSLSGSNITSGTVAAAYIGAHNHSTSNITSGVLPISYGGTGMNTRYQYVNLATVSYAEKANYEIPLGYPLSDYKLMIIEVFANSSNNNTNIVYFTFSVPILINGDNGHTTDSHISIATSSHYRTFYYVTGTNIIYFDGADSNTNLIPRRIWGVN